MSEMWVFCSPEKNIALYQYKPSRGGKVAKEMLKGFSGYLQTDGYSAYNAVESVTRVGCWAHARRNRLDPFGYLLFLLQELPKLGNEPTREQLLPLLPWSTALPEYCHLS